MLIRPQFEIQSGQTATYSWNNLVIVVSSFIPLYYRISLDFQGLGGMN